MSEKQVRKQKTRYFYTDYVNHMVRFYLSTPEKLPLDGKKRADIENWVAVQAIFHELPDDKRQVLTEVYKAHFRVPEGVRIYCEKTGTNSDELWKLIAKTSAAIARRRGLI